MKDNITVVHDTMYRDRYRNSIKVLLWYGPFHGEIRKISRNLYRTQVIYGNKPRAEYVNYHIRTHYSIDKVWCENSDYPVLVHRETAETILAFGPNPPWETDSMEPPF